jgi:hypothetical protein
MKCWEENGFLFFKIRDHNDALYDKVIIENL